MTSSFFALILRMKWIQRWGLMRNGFSDNLAEHSLDTAIFAHALCLIGNRRYGKQLDAGRCALLALYHDAGEIITGDMPTPVKYRSAALRGLYREVEREAVGELLAHLPDDLREDYRPLLDPDGSETELMPYLKAADKLAAYVKCLQETAGGSREFASALRAQRQALEEMGLPEVEDFLRDFIPAFSMSLDEQQQLSGREKI